MRFDIHPELASLPHPFPGPSELLRVARLSSGARGVISQLWLSEGLPFAFSNQPALYCATRLFIAQRLGLSPKAVSLVGSARLGRSLAHGTEFSSTSDLDFLVVSQDLFANVTQEFERWASMYAKGDITPTIGEAQYWDGNSKNGARTILRGFLDPKFIPNRQPFPMVRRIAETMAILHRKLEGTEGAPRTRKNSLRVYRDWDAFMAQTTLNLSILAHV